MRNGGGDGGEDEGEGDCILSCNIFSLKKAMKSCKETVVWGTTKWGILGRSQRFKKSINKAAEIVGVSRAGEMVLFWEGIKQN